jgi:hypothetical protein
LKNEDGAKLVSKLPFPHANLLGISVSALRLFLPAGETQSGTMPGREAKRRGTMLKRIKSSGESGSFAGGSGSGRSEERSFLATRTTLHHQEVARRKKHFQWSDRQQQKIVAVLLFLVLFGSINFLSKPSSWYLYYGRSATLVTNVRTVPYHYEPAGASSRRHHHYNMTLDPEAVIKCQYHGSVVYEGEGIPYSGQLQPLLVPPSIELQVNFEQREFNGIQYRPAKKRKVRKYDDDLYEAYRATVLASYLATEENENDEPHWNIRDKDVNPAYECIWPADIITTKPVCNNVHASDFTEQLATENQELALKYLGSGYYRNTFLVPAAGGGRDDDTVDFVWKRQRLAHGVTRQRMQQIQTEAVVMEALTASDRVSSIYGHCGLTVAVEAAVSDLENKLMPLRLPACVEKTSTGCMPRLGRMRQEDLDEAFQKDGVYPLNEWRGDYPEGYTPEQKLDLLLAMMEGVAETHGLPTGPLVNLDVSGGQWLVGRDGRIILNDFDNGVPLGWNVTHQHYCPHMTGYMGGFKAPEEHHWGPVEESVDLFKVGSVIYAALTGLKPYYDEFRTDNIWTKLDRGELPYIDPRYRNRSLIEGRLVEIMEQCYQLKPEDRVDIFQVVEHLRETKRMFHDAKLQQQQRQQQQQPEQRLRHGL